VFDLRHSEVFEHRRNVIPESPSVALAESVDPADGVVGRTRPGFERAGFAGLCSSALPGGIQSPFATNISRRSSMYRRSYAGFVVGTRRAVTASGLTGFHRVFTVVAFGRSDLNTA
jgi:hypothetical protein